MAAAYIHKFDTTNSWKGKKNTHKLKFTTVLTYSQRQNGSKTKECVTIFHPLALTGMINIAVLVTLESALLSFLAGMEIIADAMVRVLAVNSLHSP